MMLWVTLLSRSDGQIQIFARSLNNLEGRISVIVPSNATVHDLITVICDESGIPQNAIPSITLDHAGTALSPLDTLADVGVGSGTEVTVYLRRHALIATMDYTAENIYRSNNFRVERNVSISMGYADILEGIKGEIHEWTAAQDPATSIPPGSRRPCCCGPNAIDRPAPCCSPPGC